MSGLHAGFGYEIGRVTNSQKVLSPHPSRIQLRELPDGAKPLEDRRSTGFQDRHGYILSQ